MAKSRVKALNDRWEALARKGRHVDVGPRQFDLIDERWIDTCEVKTYRSFPSGLIEPSRYEFVERDAEHTILAVGKTRGGKKPIRQRTRIAVYNVRSM